MAPKNVQISTSKARPKLVLVHKALETDEQVIERVKAGDKHAFRIIVRKYKSNVASVVRNMVGPGPEAEDIGQEVFIRFFKSLPNFRYESSVSTYLTRIAINLSLNTIKKRSRLRKRLVSGIEIPEIPGQSKDQLENNELRGELNKALDKLSEEHRMVIVLRLIQGLSTQETADALQIPVGTVLSRLSRAQRNMRDSLEIYLQRHG